MKAIKVQYTVEQSFAATNAKNIQNVMNALKANPIDGLAYSAFQLADGQTFMHVLVARDEETQSRVPALPEFQEFQTALKASKPISPPATEELNVVGTSFDI